MNILAAIAKIEEVLAVVESYNLQASARLLKEALAALQPQRYVLHDGLNMLYVLDQEHPEYKVGVLNMCDPWVVLIWFTPGPIERQKARAIVEHLNSTLPHETTT